MEYVKFSWYDPRRWFGVKKLAVDPNVSKGIKPGSVAVDTTLPGLKDIASALTAQLNMVQPLIPFEYYSALLNVTILDPTISQSINDKIMLGNRGHKLILEGPDSAVEKAAIELENFSRRMYAGGFDMWVSAAMYQLMTIGALSHEWVILDNLKGVKRSKFVPADSIRFAAAPERDGSFIVFQKHEGKDIILNPLTYEYRPMLTWENNPYAIPPLFAALEPVFIKRDVVKNIRGISKKIGLLGLFQIMLSRPEQDFASGETNDKYAERLKGYLKDAADALEKNFNDGILIGFEGQHKFDHSQVTGDARGMGEIYDKVDIELNSGANTDPSLHGRNMSRTETHIRQVYKKLVRQIESVRSVATKSAEYGFELHLALAGIPNVDVTVEWEPIESLDNLRDEEVMARKIDNARALYEDGIISQDERAQMLGYDSPDLEEPRSNSNAIGGQDAPSEQQSNVSTYEYKAGRYKLVRRKAKLKKKRKSRRKSDDSETMPLFDWPWDMATSCGHSHGVRGSVQSASDEFRDKVDTLLERYIKSMNASVVQAGAQTVEVVREYLKSSARQAPPEEFAAEVYRVIARDFTARMGSDSIKAKINKWATALYKEARLGAGVKSTLGGLAGDFEPTFNAITDTQTLRFLKETDLFYMGKFVNRNEVSARMQKRIADEYIAVGRDFRDRAFIEGIAETLSLEYWQAERVVRSTANMSRNFASVRTLEEAKFAQFRVTGPDDALKCDWCRGMLGRTFSVKEAVKKIERVIQGGAASVPLTAPILVSSISVEDLGKLTDKELQSKGFDTPPFHPNCRDRITAV